MHWWNSDARERVPDTSSGVRGAQVWSAVYRALTLKPILNGHKAGNKSTIKWVNIGICSYCYYECIKKNETFKSGSGWYIVSCYELFFFCRRKSNVYIFIYINCKVAVLSLQRSWFGLLWKLKCIFREFVNHLML